MKKFLVIIVFLGNLISASGQRLEGEYQTAALPTSDLNLNLTLLCDKTFFLKDSSLTLSGTWRTNHKWILILTCNTIKRTAQSNEELFTESFRLDPNGEYLIWNLYSEQAFKILRTGNAEIEKQKFSKKEVPKNRFIRMKSFLPCEG